MGFGILPGSQTVSAHAEGCSSSPGRANPVWLDPFCRNMELAAQAEHEDDLPENLSEITDLWNSPARTHVRHGPRHGGTLLSHAQHLCHLLSCSLLLQGTFGREPSAAKPEDDRYLRAAIQEYDNIAKLGQIMREGPIKVSDECGHPPIVTTPRFTAVTPNRFSPKKTLG